MDNVTTQDVQKFVEMARTLSGVGGPNTNSAGGLTPPPVIKTTNGGGLTPPNKPASKRPRQPVQRGYTGNPPNRPTPGPPQARNPMMAARDPNSVRAAIERIIYLANAGRRYPSPSREIVRSSARRP